MQRPAYQALARALRSKADLAGLSVRDLAAKLGRPSTTVHKTLGGQRRLDPIEFLEWCEVLGVDDPIALIESVRRK
ncbi:MAG: helix-turn-helix domain-containing protein [Phycisphaerales bacterium]